MVWNYITHNKKNTNNRAKIVIALLSYIATFPETFTSFILSYKILPIHIHASISVKLGARSNVGG